MCSKRESQATCCEGNSCGERPQVCQKRLPPALQGVQRWTNKVVIDQTIHRNLPAVARKPNEWNR